MPQVLSATAPTAKPIQLIVSTMKPFYIKITADNMFPDIAVVEFKTPDIFDSYKTPNLDLSQLKADFIKLPTNNISKVILIIPQSFIDHVEDASKYPSRAADEFTTYLRDTLEPEILKQQGKLVLLVPEKGGSGKNDLNNTSRGRLTGLAFTVAHNMPTAIALIQGTIQSGALLTGSSSSSFAGSGNLATSPTKKP